MSIQRIWTSEYPYHICNRSIDKNMVFHSSQDNQRFIKTISYYCYQKPPLRISDYERLNPKAKEFAKQQLYKEPQYISVAAYCLMPTHFHLLLYPSTNTALTTFMLRITDSYTKYFNKKYKRTGPIFEGPFKATMVESEEQLMHVSRYIHLNPYTNYIVSNIHECEEYPWSSYKIFLTSQLSWIKKENILNLFPNTEAYHTFVSDQATYQRLLASVKEP